MKRKLTLIVFTVVLLLAIAGGPSATNADDLPDSATAAECTPATRQACYQGSVAFFNSCMHYLNDSNYCGNLAWHFRNNCQTGAGCPPMTGNPDCWDRTGSRVPC
jgi:hypothetical protein